ncbi:transcription repressor OFP15-like [Euphorbia lathyris]|uniref:transcription repressor OFP15-like n=1 Tax=Euphorbia lathyris TaxID=212925 RepID=UPI003313995F
MKKKLPFFLSKISPNIYCQQPRTLSFRTPATNMVNPIYNSDKTPPEPDTPVVESSEKSVESVIDELRSVDRLFFKPENTSSILEEGNRKSLKVSETDRKCLKLSENGRNCMKVSENEDFFIEMTMDSEDPYLDFKKSMEEMVEAQGLKDWGSLEELLWCYLKVNGKNNHGYIIAAFVDLLVNLAFFTSDSGNFSCSSCSYSSPLSLYTSSNFSDDSSSSNPYCISSLEEEADDDDDDDDEIKDVN